MPSERHTKTSPFGSQGKISHDSSHFYASRMYSQQPVEDASSPYFENPIPTDVLDQILLASSEEMHHLPDSCAHLMVTSPPYNARKEYDDDLT